MATVVSSLAQPIERDPSTNKPATIWRSVLSSCLARLVLLHPPSLEATKRHALESFERQLAFGRTHSLFGKTSPAQSGPDFAAFHAMEYEGSLSANELECAREEVLCALTNLYRMDEIKTRMRAAEYLVPQRALMFRHTDHTVRAVPDLIAFYRDQPPLIFDWKVHVFGLQEAWLQLAVYALALLRATPHKDFPGRVTERSRNGCPFSWKSGC